MYELSIGNCGEAALASIGNYGEAALAGLQSEMQTAFYLFTVYNSHSPCGPLDL